MSSTPSCIHRVGSPLAIVLITVACCAGSAFGQAQIGSGRALDNSLRVGDSGYNYGGSRYGPGGGALASPAYVPAGSRVRAAASGSGPYAGLGRQYSPYTGGALQERDRITNYDTYLNDRAYSAGWQSRTNRYSSYSGPPGGSSGGGSAGAYRIDTRMR